MATNVTGISRDLIIHPGETIGDILEERGISQAELATRTGVTPTYINNVIKGKKDISAKFALSLEYALGVSKSFWINLQANYDAELLEANESATITEEERNTCHSLNEIIKYLREEGRIPVDIKNDSLILSLRKVFQISNISNLKSIIPNGAFRLSSKAKVDPYVMGAWIRLCQIAGENRKISNSFDKSKVSELVSKTKDIMCNQDKFNPDSLKNLFFDYGIDFSIARNFRGAPVNGYISKKKDMTYQMVLTIRGSYADIFWFSLFHELAHIVNDDLNKSGSYIDYDKNDIKETLADEFACNSLIDPDNYCCFIEQANFTWNSIETFAKSQNVKPYIVLGRLQREHLIEYSRFASKKTRYKWA